jgi:hypothetical protein
MVTNFIYKVIQVEAKLEETETELKKTQDTSQLEIITVAIKEDLATESSEEVSDDFVEDNWEVNIR